MIQVHFNNLLKWHYNQRLSKRFLALTILITGKAVPSYFVRVIIAGKGKCAFSAHVELVFAVNKVARSEELGRGVALRGAYYEVHVISLCSRWRFTPDALAIS